ncbi:MAG: hypothetical protein IJ357_07180, partial [Oscillospiraceae bacterium]|nr:hypothetical protein [Oscillospiraceae bacterium]
MKTRDWFKRILSAVLALVIVLGACPQTMAAAASDHSHRLTLEQVENPEADVLMETPAVETPEDPTQYADTDSVRVSIVLEQQPTLELYSTEAISSNTEAMAYRQQLQSEQETVIVAIERQALSGTELDVVWNL